MRPVQALAIDVRPTNDFDEMILFSDVEPNTQKGKAFYQGMVIKTKNCVGLCLRIATATIPWHKKVPNFLSAKILRRKPEYIESNGAYWLFFYKEVDEKVARVDCGTTTEFHLALSALELSPTEQEFDRVSKQYKFSIKFLVEAFSIYKGLQGEGKNYLDDDLKTAVLAKFTSASGRFLGRENIELDIDLKACTLFVLAQDPKWSPIFRTWQLRNQGESANRIKNAETRLRIMEAAEFIGLVIFAILYYNYPIFGFKDILSIGIGFGLSVFLVLVPLVGKYMPKNESNL